MLTGWGYRRSLALSMARAAVGHSLSIETDAPTIPIAKSPLVVRSVDPAAVSAASQSTEQAAAAARHLTRKFCAAHVVAAATYMAIANTSLLLAERESRVSVDVGIVIVFFLLLPQIVIVLGLPRYSLKTWIITLAAYGFAGLIL